MIDYRKMFILGEEPERKRRNYQNSHLADAEYSDK